MSGNDYRLEAEAEVQGYFNRKGAADYASSVLGRKVSVASFHRMASDGTGPRYVMLLGHASYRREWLDEWIAAAAREPKKRPRKAEPLTRRNATAVESAPDAGSPGYVAA